MQKDKEKKKMINYFKINRLSLNKILNALFNFKIKRIRYLGNNLLNKMPEYNFNLLKFNVVLNDFTNYTIFVKLIDKCKIQESLFCFWFFCEEKYSYNTSFSVPKANIINYKSQKYEKKYELQFINKKNKIEKSSFVNIINLNEYVKEKINVDNKKEIEKYLFIGII